MKVTEEQAKRLEIRAYSRWSPYLEKYCLLLSANESYKRAAADIEVLTGIKVPQSCQHRLVHRQTFEDPMMEQGIKEMSVDGGKIRIRTPEGQPCIWRDYKGVNLHQGGVNAFYRENESLVAWVNEQPLSHPLVCRGDGHDGI